MVKPHLTRRGSHSSPGCFILTQRLPRGRIKQVCLVSSAACCVRVLQQPLDICALVGMQAMQMPRWQLGRVQASRVPCTCGLHKSLGSRCVGWRHALQCLCDQPKQMLLVPGTSRAVAQDEQCQMNKQGCASRGPPAPPNGLPTCQRGCSCLSEADRPSASLPDRRCGLLAR